MPYTNVHQLQESDKARGPRNALAIPDLHTEVGYLQLLTALFPDRDDIKEISDWFEAQVLQIDPY
jgi:hypothetical protein